MFIFIIYRYIVVKLSIVMHGCKHFTLWAKSSKKQSEGVRFC